jgi:hypothetical protein
MSQSFDLVPVQGSNNSPATVAATSNTYESMPVTLSAEEVEKILLAVEQVKPEDIVSLQQLAQVGPYSIVQIRQAITQRAMECVDPKPTDSLFSEIVSYRAKKSLPGRKTCWLHVTYPYGMQASDCHLHLPQDVKLWVMNDATSCFLLDFTYPTREPGERGASPASIHFADFRQNPHRHANLWRMQDRGASLDDIRHMWSGVRWLCCALREWHAKPI